MHITIGDAEKLWQTNREMSWEGLRRVLERHGGELSGGADEANIIAQAVYDLQNEGASYPVDADKLSDVLEARTNRE